MEEGVEGEGEGKGCPGLAEVLERPQCQKGACLCMCDMGVPKIAFLLSFCSNLDVHLAWFPRGKHCGCSAALSNSRYNVQPPSLCLSSQFEVATVLTISWLCLGG